MYNEKSLYVVDAQDDDFLIKTQWPDHISQSPQGIPTLTALKELILRSLPLIITFFAVFSIKNISMHYLRDQPDITMISAVGIAFTLTTVFATAVFISLNVGLVIKATDAYNAETYQNVGILLHKGLIINTIFLIPSFIILCISDKFCLLIGFDSLTSGHVQRLIYLSLPGTFLLMIFTTLTSYINACNRFSAPQLIQIIAAGIFWGIAYVFTRVHGLGLEGIAYSYNIMYALAVFGLILYIKVKDPAPGTFFWFRKESFHGLVKLFMHQFMAGWAVFIEYIVFEIIFLFCAALNNTEIVGFTISFNNLPIIYVLPTAFSDTMMNHIIASIQERDIKKAQKFLRVGIGLNMLSMAIVLGIYLNLVQRIANFYVDEPNVLEMAIKILRLYTIIIVPDFIQMGLQSALKAIGKDGIGTKIRNVCYYFIALPLAYCLCYIVDLRSLGLILGPMIGVTLMTLISIVIFWRTKWSDVIRIVVGGILFDGPRSTTDVDEKEGHRRSLSMAL